MTIPVKLGRTFAIDKSGKVKRVEDPRASVSTKIAKRKSKKTKPIRRTP